MKSLAHKIFATTMALMLLLSTVSWTVDKHLCMGRVMDVSFFVEAEDCGMEMAGQFLDADKHHCCDDETFTIEGQDDLKLTWDDLQLEQQVFWVAFAQSYYHLFIDLGEPPVPFTQYPPPLLVQDLNILHEVFLI
ncbi:HYC_CC_PP family protein [Allomuricauda sp. SCSIO 65647]|uniref:HYC_CC_PP family protein n=1 Tax=Allomuricauda sp. SCSIO 65647 TaxID=2908843 RepID=UPI001F2C4C8D|nr:hypothetical protein [Muricauda sp. SCSIO 65647]UJH66318.1 hypothetical protein L0P89_10085 [Muricauda sp. SCSIO 65647]